LILDAVYKAKYVYVTFDFNNGGDVLSVQIVENGGFAVLPPEEPVKEGYTFIEWQLNGVAYDFSAPVTSDLYLVAVYKAVTSTTHDVTFNSDGGTLIQLRMLTAAVLSLNLPTLSKSVMFSLNGN
jgi:Listeria-Bacteroides repeat domain (List_Bact_rpt).